MEIGARSIQISIGPEGTAGQARREAILLSRQLGFSETETGNVAIAATEAATNLLKHAHGGRIILRALNLGQRSGLELLAIDSGPGMRDTHRCLADGFSTAGSPGTGLGAIARLSSFFDIYSVPDKGTVLLAQFGPLPELETSRLLVGAVCLPIIERELSGDAWALKDSLSTPQFLVADGLGHGILAAQAADEAVRVFCAASSLAPAQGVRSMHGPLRPTRGASLAIAELDLAARSLRWSGVGNIAGTIWHEGSSRSMVSHNGTVGHEMQQVAEFVYPFPRRAILIMHSDGVSSRWRLEQYAGLAARHPSIVAAVLLRDFRRERDDATVLVARER